MSAAPTLCIAFKVSTKFVNSTHTPLDTPRPKSLHLSCKHSSLLLLLLLLQLGGFLVSLKAHWTHWTLPG